MDSKTIQVYNENAEMFEAQYLSASVETIHSAWLEYFHLNGVSLHGQALDIGAGVGRDALWLADQGMDVVAVEPSEEMRNRGKLLTNQKSVFWLDDQLPALSKVEKLETRFDLILVSAVWMHVPESYRERAFRKMSNLLKPGGFLVMTLRNGESPDERVMYPVSADEVKQYAQSVGVKLNAIVSEDDKLKRQDVYWETLILSLPDDGAGTFPLVRNILLNDAKSSTYKLALMRVLLRIADGHPGSVLRREDGRVILPLGLVALYWIRQYMPLLKEGVQQSSNANKGLGFVKSDGWGLINHRSIHDFSIGNLFVGEQAVALHKTLKSVASTIKNMPAKYITLPKTDKQVFEVSLFARRSSEFLFCDLDTLASYGEFSVPEKIWDLMSLYAVWIEPVVLSEWVQVMKVYENNSDIADYRLMSLLSWSDASRTTQEARKRLAELQKDFSVECVWSHKALGSQFDIDHCLPYKRWPNNDLWNLMPSTQKINREKSDRIASLKRLQQSEQYIQNWWDKAWVDTEKDNARFFAQANMALPGLDSSNQSAGDVFEALKLQHVRLREMQQLVEW